MWEREEHLPNQSFIEKLQDREHQVFPSSNSSCASRLLPFSFNILLLYQVFSVEYKDE